MITIGLTTWSEHQSLLANHPQPLTLTEYAAFFPTVEVDTTFYALPQAQTIRNWQAAVPATFQFIFKAPQELTTHNGVLSSSALKTSMAAFITCLRPLLVSHQVKTILFQFPPYFTATSENYIYLQRLRQLAPSLPIAVEFRHESWLTGPQKTQTVTICHQLHYTLVAADEPHHLPGSVPFVLAQTTPNLILIRLHGRNAVGWGNRSPEWRKKRTLYRYSDQELTNLARLIRKHQTAAQEFCVIFNNNSGGDAAPNAQALQGKLQLHFDNLAPKPPEQTDLF